MEGKGFYFPSIQSVNDQNVVKHAIVIQVTEVGDRVAAVRTIMATQNVQVPIVAILDQVVATASGAKSRYGVQVTDQMIRFRPDVTSVNMAIIGNAVAKTGVGTVTAVNAGVIMEGNGNRARNVVRSDESVMEAVVVVSGGGDHDALLVE